MACQYSRSCRSASGDDSNRRTVSRAGRDAAALVSMHVLYWNRLPGGRRDASGWNMETAAGCDPAPAYSESGVPPPAYRGASEERGGSGFAGAAYHWSFGTTFGTSGSPS